MWVIVWNCYVESVEICLYVLKDVYYCDFKFFEVDFNVGLVNIVVVMIDLREVVEDVDLVIEVVLEVMEVKEVFYEEFKVVVFDKMIVVSNFLIFMFS